MFKRTQEIIRVPMKKDVRKPEPPEPKKYKCNICMEGWQSETDLEFHRRQSHHKMMNKMLLDNNNSICMICISNQKTPENLLSHIKTDHLLSSGDAVRVEREIYICNDCTKIFFNKQMLVVHMAVRHRNVRSKTHRVECPKCFKHVKCNAIWSHFQFEDILSIACCPMCLTKCQNTVELKTHILQHQSYLYCNICRYCTKSESNFREHVLKHRDKFKKVDDVDKLNVSQYFISNIRYMQWRSLRISSFKGLNLPPNVKICILCREICQNSDEMKQHYMVHVNVDKPAVKRKYACECGEEFFNNVLLKHHIFKLKGEHRAV